jgi:nicotinate phosphoribosyltransferase
MMQGYYLNKHNPEVVFDMFYRTNPFEGGYVVFAGLHDLVDKLEALQFSDTVYRVSWQAWACLTPRSSSI